MPMAKELFNEWRRTREKYYRDAGCDEDRLLWRAFCAGFYAAKKLDQDRMVSETTVASGDPNKEVKYDQETTQSQKE